MACKSVTAAGLFIFFNNSKVSYSANAKIFEVLSGTQENFILHSVASDFYKLAYLLYPLKEKFFFQIHFDTEAIQVVAFQFDSSSYVLYHMSKKFMTTITTYGKLK